MLRLLVVAAGMLTMLFALAVGATRIQPQNDLISSNFGGCAMPCWQGVQPGKTARVDALKQLDARGWLFQAECNAAVYDACYDFMRAATDPVAFVYFGGDQVKEIALFSAGLSVGDMWLAFGSPQYAAISPQTYRAAFLNSAFWFGPNQISTRTRYICPIEFGEMMRAPVDTILLWEPGTTMEGTTFGQISDLRRVIHQVCGP